MDIKYLSIFGLFLISFLFSGCPVQEDCGLITKEVVVPDLINISPLESVYSVETEIECSVILPSNNSFFQGEDVDIFQVTQTDEVSLNNTEIHKLFEINQFTVIEGSYVDNTPVLKYYLNENEYRFKARIILSKAGNYSLFARGLIYFKKPNKCTSFSLDTNIEGMNEDDKIEFIVNQ